MPSAYPTLLDIVKRNGSDAVVGLIDETTKAHPELTKGAARTIKGLNYKTRVRVGLPTVGFRNANDGVDATHGMVENRLVEVFLMNPRWECDKAVADVAEDGPEAYIAEEAAAMVEASMQAVASQFYYGITDDPNKGFPGLIAAYDATNMVVDATGSTANTGSSVWAVRWNPQDVQWVWGNGGAFPLSDVSLQRILGTNNKPLTAYCQEMIARPGLQVGSKWSVGRIKKLTEDSTKGLTDKLIAKLLEKFPVGKAPDVLYMSRRSLRQLQESRTATNATGAPAPFPTESFGIPIEVTDAIVDTESLTL